MLKYLRPIYYESNGIFNLLSGLLLAGDLALTRWRTACYFSGSFSLTIN